MDTPNLAQPPAHLLGQAPGAPVRSGTPEHGRIPKYYAVKARIAALTDELGVGQALPTERDLAERYEVARETVRQALRELLLGGRRPPPPPASWRPRSTRANCSPPTATSR